MKRIKRRARRAAADLKVLPLLRPRRIDVCCCGLSKTGTHSMSGLFANFRSAHHPDAGIRLDLAIALLRGNTSATDIIPVLQHRDRHLWLEMESSTLSGTLIEPFYAALPEKSYILTIRDAYSWMESLTDHNLNRPNSKSRFATLDRLRLRGEEFPHTRHDEPLRARGLASLASYFSLWYHHNRRVLDVVPDERLLIVNTQDIVSRIEDIAAFVGVAPTALRAELGWQFATPKKHHVLSTLDPSYVRDTADRICGELMDRFFPGQSPPTKK